VASVASPPEGKVKVLDFGLAKAFEGDSANENMSNSPTLSRAATMQGVILGTAAYMSPEQARGKNVDKRTDLWAFGAVLYEMLTGKQAFHGEDVTDILAAVVRAEPEWNRLPENTPPAIRVLLRRCLQKDKTLRMRDAGDARIEIQEALAWIAEGGSHGAPVVSSRKNRERLAWSFAGIVSLALIATVASVIFVRRPAEEPRILKTSVLLPEKAVLNPRSIPAVSPDGRRLAFVATLDGKDQLWVRDLDSLAARPLPGTDGADHPFWSPDSRFIAFYAGGKLKKIDVAGGPAVSLCDAASGGTGYGGSWSQNDVILFSPASNVGLVRVSAAGGDATLATTLDQVLGETNHRFPWFLPDGHHFLYTALTANQEKNGVYVADLDSKARRQVLGGSTNAIYVSPGYLLFVRERTLMAQRFDAVRLQTTGDPFPIAEEVDSSSVAAQSQFSSSQNSVLAYTSGASGTGGEQLTWLDRTGKVLGTVGTPALMRKPSISADGDTVAIDRLDPQTGSWDIWLHDLVRGTASRFTFNSKNNAEPQWSPDDSHIAFYSTRDGPINVYQKATSGAAQDEAVDKSALNKLVQDWSRDGRYIIENIIGAPKTGFDIWVLPLFGDRKPFPYLQTEFNEHSPKLSPDGHWLAYASNETKRDEVYVQTFPTPGGKWQISTDGGSRPVWSRDGKELFFIGGRTSTTTGVGTDQKMMVTEIKTDSATGGAKFQASVPKALFDTHLPANAIVYFDVSKDGRFLMPVQVEQQSANVSMTVVVNWTAGLKK